jgi:hypothetical protein
VSENQPAMNSLTMADLEAIVTRIARKVISQQQEGLVPDDYKREIPFDTTATSFCQSVVESSSRIPDEIWDTVPSDASENKAFPLNKVHKVESMILQSLHTYC